MKKYIKWFPFVAVFTFVLLFLLIYVFSKDKATKTDYPTNRAEPFLSPESSKTDVSKNSIKSVSYVKIEGNEIVVILSNKEERYILPDKIFFLCLNKDYDAYYKLINDSDIVDSSFMIGRQDIETTLNEGEVIEVFIYHHLTDKTYLKGIVLNECI